MKHNYMFPKTRFLIYLTHHKPISQMGSVVVIDLARSRKNTIFFTSQVAAVFGMFLFVHNANVNSMDIEVD
jgi:hypothetical protein